MRKLSAALLLALPLLSAQAQTNLPTATDVVGEVLYYNAVRYTAQDKTPQALALLDLLSDRGRIGKSAQLLRYKLLCKADTPQAQTQALALGEELLRLYPRDSALTRTVAGLMVPESGREENIPILERFRSAAPESTDLKLLLCFEYWMQDRNQEARALQEAIRIDLLSEDLRDPYLELSRDMAYQSNQYPRALEYNAEFLKRNPQDIDAMAKQVALLTTLNRPQEVEKLLPQMSALTGGAADPQYSTFLVNHYLSSNRVSEALMALSSYIEQTSLPIDPNPMIVYLGFLQSNPEYASQSLPFMRRWIGIDPQDRELIPLYAALYAQSHSDEEVLREVESFTQSPKTARNAYSFILDYLGNTEQLPRLEEKAREALRLYPQDYEFIYALAYSREGQGDRQEAVKLLTDFLKAHPHTEPQQQASAALYIADLIGSSLAEQNAHSDARQSDAYTAQEQDLIAQAGEWYRVSIEQDPQNPLALNNYAYFLYSYVPTELSTARKLAEQALAIDPNSPNINDTYGEILMALEEHLMAEIYFRKAVDLAKQQGAVKPVYYRHLAAALKANGKEAQAAQVLKEIQ